MNMHLSLEMAMGGSAYLIPGVVDARLWQEAQHRVFPAPPRSLWSRLTGLGGGSETQTFPKVTTYPNGDRLIEPQVIPILDHLIPDLLNWVQSCLATPSQASRAALEYLRTIMPTLYMRGHQRLSEPNPNFYIQVTFSGCAGMAETSARLSSHWAMLWYRTNHDRLTRDYLAPGGFQPDPYDPVQDEPLLFLPLGQLGYVEYLPSEVPTARPIVELDQSIIDSWSGGLDIERVTEVVERYMTVRRCRCQLCEPALGDIPFD